MADKSVFPLQFMTQDRGTGKEGIMGKNDSTQLLPGVGQRIRVGDRGQVCNGIRRWEMKKPGLSELSG
ncbi:hypothetical protein D4S03_03085 [bacterium]|nr:MAG: hypothetical protein D4S03_03085 [bacterium]